MSASANTLRVMLMTLEELRGGANHALDGFMEVDGLLSEGAEDGSDYQTLAHGLVNQAETATYEVQAALSQLIDETENYIRRMLS